MNTKDKRIAKMEQYILKAYELLSEVMEEEDPAVTNKCVADTFQEVIEALMLDLEDLTAAMVHHDKLNKGP
jgi:hypothetical protein